MKKSAFTLIELLVVISIIAILASLAMPAMSKVMERGRAVQDANNLRQIGLGVTGYLNDNSDVYFTGTGTAWAPLLNGTSGTVYIPSWKVFQSPFDTRASSNAGDTTTPISYDVNANLMGKSISDVTSPSNCVLMAVFLSGSLSPISAKGTLTKENIAGTFNNGKLLDVLFSDSHVAQIRQTTVTGTTYWTP